jgi:hypothetical protein
MALAHPVDSGEPVEPIVESAIPRAASSAQAATAVAGCPAWHAFQLLHWAFVILPIVAGTNKFFELGGPRQSSLAPLFSDLLGVSMRSMSYALGAAEIVIGIIVAFSPWLGGWLVAAWLWVIIAAQLLGPGHVDVALLDTALSLGALALSRLAIQFDETINPVVRSAQPAPARARPPIAA